MSKQTSNHTLYTEWSYDVVRILWYLCTNTAIVIVQSKLHKC